MDAFIEGNSSDEGISCADGEEGLPSWIEEILLEEEWMTNGMVSYDWEAESPTSM